MDGELALNIFSFERQAKAGIAATATRADAARIIEFINEVKAGKHAADPSVPKYNEALFGDKALDEYLTRMRPSYASSSDPRRFLIQRELFEQIRGSDRAAIHVEPFKVINSSLSPFASLAFLCFYF